MKKKIFVFIPVMITVLAALFFAGCDNPWLGRQPEDDSGNDNVPIAFVGTWKRTAPPQTTIATFSKTKINIDFLDTNTGSAYIFDVVNLTVTPITNAAASTKDAYPNGYKFKGTVANKTGSAGNFWNNETGSYVAPVNGMAFSFAFHMNTAKNRFVRDGTSFYYDKQADPGPVDTRDPITSDKAFNKFPAMQVRDCFRSPANPTNGQSMTLSNFGTPVSSNKVTSTGGGPWMPVAYIDTAGAYFQLSWPGGAPNANKNLTLDFCSSNGTVLETVATQGRIAMFFNEGFLFLGDGGSTFNLRGVVGYVFWYEPQTRTSITVTSFVMP